MAKFIRHTELWDNLHALTVLEGTQRRVEDIKGNLKDSKWMT